MDYRNNKVEKLLNDGGELLEYKGYAVRKKDGNIVFVTNDNTNIITDRYICITDEAGQFIACHRDELADNPFTRMINEIKDKMNVAGKELEKVASFVIENKISSLTDEAVKAIEKFLKGE
jgi:uncharacterized protein (UPF0371 family)